jgi:uncharacterized protein YicC (UPF0701 family)
VRFASLPDDVVTGLLVERGIEPSRAAATSKLSRGSLEVALDLADPEQTEEREAFVTQALQALVAADLGPALELAEQAKKQKDELPVRLLALATRLAEQARTAADAPDRRAEVAAARYRLALGAARELDGNAAPQLVVESMLFRMRGA